jgi:hypothetical protein
MLKNITHIIAVFTLLSFTHASAQLAVSATGAAGKTTYDPGIVTSLITEGQASLGSVDAPISRNDPSFSADGLNDDSAATTENLTYYEVAGDPRGLLPATITFNFNLDASTGGSANGYTLTNIQSITGWGNANLADQNLEVSLSFDGGASYSILGTGYYVDNTSAGGGANSADLSFTDDSGVIAQNVTNVQFAYALPTASDQGGAGGTVLHELDGVRACGLRAPQGKASAGGRGHRRGVAYC